MGSFTSSGTDGNDGSDGAAGLVISDPPKAATGPQGFAASCGDWSDVAPTNGGNGGGGGQGSQGNSGQAGKSGDPGGNASDMLIHGEAILGSFTIAARGGNGG